MIKNHSKFNIKNSTLAMDVSDLINDFGYKPDTSLKVGIERFVEWYREFYQNKKEKNV